MSPVSITQPVGLKCPNLQSDQFAVEAQLRAAGIPFYGPRTLAGDIQAFQRICGLPPTGRIEPHSRTLRILNAVTSPPVLWIGLNVVVGEGDGASTVSSQRVREGGYSIAYSTDDGGPLPMIPFRANVPTTPFPPAYRLLLGPDRANSVDVTGRPSTDLLNEAKLGELLKVIERLDAWGRPLMLRLHVVRDQNVVWESAPVMLQCPVRPHSGKMLSPTANADLDYLGNAATKRFWGRMFLPVAGYDKYVFCWGGRLELDPAKRGFDCITYAGTTCLAPHTAMGGRGADLAAALGATEVTHGEVRLESAKMEQIRTYFDTDPGGAYLLYAGGHVTLVVDGVVHEFKPGRPGNKGFTQASVADWTKAHADGWTLRKLKERPKLASK
jgi:hypothetical protein